MPGLEDAIFDLARLLLYILLFPALCYACLLWVVRLVR